MLHTGLKKSECRGYDASSKALKQWHDGNCYAPR